MALTKVALVIPGFQSSSDDWCIPVFTNLARELAKRVELHIFALRYPARRDRYTIGDVHVHALGGSIALGHRVPGAGIANLWARFLSEIDREHRLSRFSAIVGIWATESGRLATLAARRLKLPSLVHLAGGELVYIPQIRYGNRSRGLAGLLVTSTLKRADMLTVPSGPLRRMLLTEVPAAKVRCWAPGVDTGLFAPTTRLTSQDDPFVFVTVGSLIPVKGHQLLLRGLAELRARRPDRDVRLRVVGDGPLRVRLESLASELYLTGYVAFDGDVRHDELPAVYGAADSFLLGSWHESQCMAALEAMSCGLPCVAPPVGALADIVTASRDAQPVFLYSKRTSTAVWAAMNALLDLTDAQRHGCGLAARSIVASNYEMVAQTDKLLGLLEELTGA